MDNIQILDGYDYIDIDIDGNEISFSNEEYGYFIQFEDARHFLNIVELVELLSTPTRAENGTTVYLNDEFDKFAVTFNTKSQYYEIAMRNKDDQHLNIHLDNWQTFIGALYEIRQKHFR